MSSPETAGGDLAQSRYANALRTHSSLIGLIRYWDSWLSHWDDTNPSDEEREAEEARAKEILREKIEEQLRNPEVQSKLIDDIVGFTVDSAQELHLAADERETQDV